MTDETEAVTRLYKLREYKLKPAVKLLLRGDLFFLIGVILEKAVGKNPYLWYLHRLQGSTVVECEVEGHVMNLDLSDKGVSRRIYINGVHEERSVKPFVERMCEIRDETENGVTVLEVGANIGYYVLKEAEALGEDARIFAFEPSPTNLDLLRRNIDLNGYSKQVEVVPAALGDRRGEVDFGISTHSNWNTVADTDRSDIVSTTQVEMREPTEFLSEKDLSPKSVNVVRMDLEGYEKVLVPELEDVIRGDGPTVFFIEVHPNELGKDGLRSVLEPFDEEGYDILSAVQDRKNLNLGTFDELVEFGGSHIRLILTK